TKDGRKARLRPSSGACPERSRRVFRPGTGTEYSPCRRQWMIKRVEINYRGIFQKNLAKKIGGDIVIIATRMGQVGFSNGRYSDSPERNGIPCKYFAYVSPDLSEEELEAECGANLEISRCDMSVVVDDTMCKGVEPWGWHGLRPINEKV